MVPSESPDRRLNELLAASEQTRDAAVAAIARSQILLEVTRSAHQRALAVRMASRRHRAYMRLVGVVDGEAVTAVVRDDGGVAADRPLLRRAELLVAMGEAFEAGRIPASLSGGALSSALTLIRSCDQITAVELAVAPAPAGESAARGSAGPR